jgi:predicted RecA/RadA family phage recombinase
VVVFGFSECCCGAEFVRDVVSALCAASVVTSGQAVMSMTIAPVALCHIIFAAIVPRSSDGIFVLGRTRQMKIGRDMQYSPPNKSPEPTAVGAVSSAVAVHVASRRWLSFFR